MDTIITVSPLRIGGENGGGNSVCSSEPPKAPPTFFIMYALRGEDEVVWRWKTSLLTIILDRPLKFSIYIFYNLRGCLDPCANAPKCKSLALSYLNRSANRVG